MDSSNEKRDPILAALDKDVEQSHFAPLMPFVAEGIERCGLTGKYDDDAKIALLHRIGVKALGVEFDPKGLESYLKEGKSRARIAGAEHAEPKLLDLKRLATTEPRPPQFVVPDWLPANEVTLFAAHGGSGKSTIALRLGACVASGRPWFGMPVGERRKVLFLSLEDHPGRQEGRLKRICADLRISEADLDGWLYVYDGTTMDSELMREEFGTTHITPTYQWLAEKLHETDAELFVIDGASDAYGGNENVRRSVREFIRALRRLVAKGGACLLISHVDKATAKNGDTSQGYSGSTAWNNSVRSRWYMTPRNADGKMVLHLQKVNDAADGAQIEVGWNPTTHTFDGKVILPASPSERHAAMEDANEQVWRMICEADAKGIPVPHSRSGQRQTFHVLSAQRGFPSSFRKASELYRALDRLLNDGRLVEETVKDAYRKPRLVLKACDGF